MQHIPRMTDMRKTPEEKEESELGYPSVDQPDYPYGLRICLTHEELEKLDMEEDVEVGDYLHMHCLAKVTSVSKNEVNGEEECRVELTITHIAAEDEDDENEESEESYGR